MLKFIIVSLKSRAIKQLTHLLNLPISKLDIVLIYLIVTNSQS